MSGTLFYNQKTDKVEAQIGVQTTLYNSSSGTTTPNYLNTGQGTTTTSALATSGFGSLTIFINSFSSTTANSVNNPSINIERQASFNNVDWFTYDQMSVPSTPQMYNDTAVMALASTTIPLRWTPSTLGATTTKAVPVDIIPAPWTRFIFSIPTTTNMTTGFKDGINLHVTITGQRLPSN